MVFHLKQTWLPPSARTATSWWTATRSKRGHLWGFAGPLCGPDHLGCLDLRQRQRLWLFQLDGFHPMYNFFMKAMTSKRHKLDRPPTTAELLVAVGVFFALFGSAFLAGRWLIG
jgi:hypothetical protein